MNGIVENPRYVIELARELRKNMTPSERLLWEELKDRKLSGYKFRNQHPVYRYIFDFYCHNKSLAVEIDGVVHESSKEYDEYRDEFVKSMGIDTLRIHAEDVIVDIDGVLGRILLKLKSIA